MESIINKESACITRWWALAVLLIAGFMNLIDVTIVNVALPSMQAAFDASSTQIEWIVAAYIMTYALCLLPMGRLGDILGRRRVFLWGVGVFTLGSLACGLSPSIGWMIGSRIFQAVGAAMMTPQTLAIVPVLFAPKERGIAFAMFGLSSGLAAVSGPLLAGWLLGYNLWGMEWRSIFLINIPIGLFALLMTLKVVPVIKGNATRRLDYIGIVFATLALLSVMIPLVEGRAFGWPWWMIALLVLSPFLWILLIQWLKARATYKLSQLLPFALLKQRAFILGASLLAILSSGVPSLFFTMALYLQIGYGLTPWESGLTTLPFSLGALTSSIISGRFADLWTRQRIALAGLLMCIAVIWMRVEILDMGDTFIRSSVSVPFFLAGLGLGTAISPLFQTVLSSIETDDAGSASGALQAFQQVGAALGVAVVGALYFSTIHNGNVGMGASKEVYMQAMTLGILYNVGAFGLLSLGAWWLPKSLQEKG